MKYEIGLGVIGLAGFLFFGNSENQYKTQNEYCPRPECILRREEKLVEESLESAVSPWPLNNKRRK